MSPPQMECDIASALWVAITKISGIDDKLKVLIEALDI